MDLGKSQKFFPVLFLLGLVILFFFPYLTGGKIPYAADLTGSDLTELDLPLRFLAKESFQQGQIPLWTDLLSNGFPILAEGQAGIFYPFNFILFNLLPFNLAVNFTLILNFFLAGLFVYFYCRVLKISQVGSILAALAFSFSGFFIFRFKHLNLINAAIWLPLEFYLIEKYFLSKRRPLIIIALSLVFAVQFFAGHVQITYISLMSCFIYFTFKVCFHRHEKIRKKIIEVFLFWLIVGFITFGLSAIQFLPSFEFAKISDRQSWISYENATSFQYHPANLFTFVSPYAFGNPAKATYQQNNREFGVFWENNIYFGILPLVFSLVAIFFLFFKSRKVKILTFLLLISFFFILGDFNPFFGLFWQFIPGFKLFRFPQRFLLLALISLVTLSGLGFDWFWQKALVWQSKIKSEIKSKLLFKFLLPLVLILITAIDLFVVAFNYVGTLDYDAYFNKPASVEFLEQDPDNFKILSLRWMDSWQRLYGLAGGWQNNLSLFIAGRNLLPPNLNVFWGIPTIEDRSLFEGGLGGVGRFSQYQNILLGINQSFEDTKQMAFTDQFLKLLGVQNVKYIISFFDIKETDNLKVKKEVKLDFLAPLKIYENSYYLPPILAFFKIQKIKNPDDILPVIFNPEFNPAETLILENDVDYQNQDSEIKKPDIQVDYEQVNNIKINVDFPQAGFLYLDQIYFPGWQAKIDGQPAEILRANYTFTAIQVPSGQHQIEFFYRPASYFIGKTITLLTFLGLLLYLIYYFISRKNEKPLTS
ncbi:MAG: YfhO family protein [Patescibacteria group bacterium]|jgi:hypothetical protein